MAVHVNCPAPVAQNGPFAVKLPCGKTFPLPVTTLVTGVLPLGVVVLIVILAVLAPLALGVNVTL